MKHLISLNGDDNQVAFVRGNDGDINISFDIPRKKVMWETVRIGVGNSGGQKVPGYVKDTLIKVCEAMDKWEQEEELANEYQIKTTSLLGNTQYRNLTEIEKEIFKAGYNKALSKETLNTIIELFISWNGENMPIDIANIDSAVEYIESCLNNK